MTFVKVLLIREAEYVYRYVNMNAADVSYPNARFALTLLYWWCCGALWFVMLYDFILRDKLEVEVWSSGFKDSSLLLCCASIASAFLLSFRGI